MKLKKHARFKIMTGHHLWRNVFKRFLEKKFENTPSLVMKGLYFMHCYLVLQFLYVKLNQ